MYATSPHSTVASQPDIPPIVLVIEGDPEIREQYELVLTQDGFWASGAGETQTAIDAARELRPDVIVTDVDLPGDVDAFTVVRTLREEENTRHIPVIALTRERLMRAPGVPRFAHVMRKPVAPADLTAQIRAALVRSGELRARAERLRARVPGLLARSQRALVRSRARAGRRCPRCASALHYIETHTLQTATFDYFEPCPKGCGLFCYDRAQRRLITIIG